MGKELYCNFCGKPQEDAFKLVAGPSVYICDACVEISYEIIEEAREEKRNAGMGKSLKQKGSSPKEIFNLLSERVIGQDAAKRVLSIAASNHYLRINNLKQGRLEKSNVLLVGPTGCGKTLLVKTLGEILSVPVAIVDASLMTEAGYVGSDADTALTTLINRAEGDIDLAQRGIVFVDEFDKIVANNPSSTVNRDVSGEGVQVSLLKMIEGCEMIVPMDLTKHQLSSSKRVEIDTSNILFIFGGSFQKLIRGRESNLEISGFAPQFISKNKSKRINAEDIVRFGFLPELIGRIPNIVELEELTKDQLVQCLTDPKDSIISQYEFLFSLRKNKFSVSREFLEEVATEAYNKKVGARGLRAIIEQRVEDSIFNEVDFVIDDKNAVNG